MKKIEETENTSIKNQEDNKNKKTQVSKKIQCNKESKLSKEIQENGDIKKPEHIAIIMDGNRRWAKENKLPSKFGHKKGAEVLEKISRYCNKIVLNCVCFFYRKLEKSKR